MLPGLYWLAGERVRGKIDEGLHALRSITEASTISFVDTKEVEQQHGHLARMQGELERAMEDERYEEASRIKEEIKMMLLPSQQSRRAMEQIQVEEMAQQLQRSASQSEGLLAKLAKQSWQRSVANCDTLQFARGCLAASYWSEKSHAFFVIRPFPEQPVLHVYAAGPHHTKGSPPLESGEPGMNRGSGCTCEPYIQSRSPSLKRSCLLMHAVCSMSTTVR